MKVSALLFKYNVVVRAVNYAHGGEEHQESYHVPIDSTILRIRGNSRYKYNLVLNHIVRYALCYFGYMYIMNMYVLKLL